MNEAPKKIVVEFECDDKTNQFWVNGYEYGDADLNTGSRHWSGEFVSADIVDDMSEALESLINMNRMGHTVQQARSAWGKAKSALKKYKGK